MLPPRNYTFEELLNSLYITDMSFLESSNTNDNKPNKSKRYSFAKLLAHTDEHKLIMTATPTIVSLQDENIIYAKAVNLFSNDSFEENFIPLSTFLNNAKRADGIYKNTSKIYYYDEESKIALVQKSAGEFNFDDLLLATLSKVQVNLFQKSNFEILDEFPLNNIVYELINASKLSNDYNIMNTLVNSYISNATEIQNIDKAFNLDIPNEVKEIRKKLGYLKILTPQNVATKLTDDIRGMISSNIFDFVLVQYNNIYNDERINFEQKDDNFKAKITANQIKNLLEIYYEEKIRDLQELHNITKLDSKILDGQKEYLNEVNRYLVIVLQAMQRGYNIIGPNDNFIKLEFISEEEEKTQTKTQA